MSIDQHPRITVGPDNVPRIKGTGFKVVHVVQEHLGGWDPAEIHDQHPSLTLADVYAALAYYYDHKAEMDAEIERRDKEVEELRAEIERVQGPCKVREKLRNMGLIP